MGKRGKDRGKRISVEFNKNILIIIFILIVLLILIIFFYNSSANKKSDSYECNSDNDCVQDSCCHSNSCVVISKSPECKNKFCSDDCSGLLDCNQAKCVCEKGKCLVRKNE